MEKTSKLSVLKDFSAFSRHDNGEHRDIEERVKEIDPSLLTDTLNISIIQRETDSVLALTRVVITRLQRSSDSDMTRMNGLASYPNKDMCCLKNDIYEPHNFFQSRSNPSVLSHLYFLATRQIIFLCYFNSHLCIFFFLLPYCRILQNYPRNNCIWIRWSLLNGSVGNQKRQKHKNSFDLQCLHSTGGGYHWNVRKQLWNVYQRCSRTFPWRCQFW